MRIIDVDIEMSRTKRSLLEFFSHGLLATSGATAIASSIIINGMSNQTDTSFMTKECLLTEKPVQMYC
jgi:hypothetical protein